MRLTTSSVAPRGEYESVLSFRKGEDEKVHTVDFTFRIRDRATLEIPRRKGGGS